MKTRELKAIEDALKMLRKFDIALMKHPDFRSPNTVIHNQLTPIIWRLNAIIPKP